MKNQEDSVLDKLLIRFVNINMENVILLNTPQSIKSVFKNQINYYEMCDLSIQKYADLQFYRLY